MDTSIKIHVEFQQSIVCHFQLYANVQIFPPFFLLFKKVPMSVCVCVYNAH